MGCPINPWTRHNYYVPRVALLDTLPSSGLSAVTFELWETLFLDIPELDRHRDLLRCKGLQNVLRKYEIGVSFDDLTRGLDESSTWLVNIWRTGEQVPTQEQIRYIIASATKERYAVPREAMKELEEAYVSPGLVTPLQSMLTRVPCFWNCEPEVTR